MIPKYLERIPLVQIKIKLSMKIHFPKVQNLFTIYIYWKTREDMSQT